MVGICYSDKNKALLLEKRSNNSTNIKETAEITTLSTNEIFTTLVYRIITEITADKKTYTDITESSMNELNIYLKQTPIQFLIKLLNDYNTDKDNNINEYSVIKKRIEDEDEDGNMTPYIPLDLNNGDAR